MTARGVGGGVSSVYPPSSSIGLPVGLAVGRGVGRGVEVGAFGDGSGGVDWVRWIVAIISAAVLVVIASTVTGRNSGTHHRV